MKAWARILSWQGASCTLANILGQIGLALMMLAIVADVIRRYLFNSPIPGVTEVVQLAMVVVVYLGLAYTLRTGGHVRIMILRSHLSPKVNKAIEVLCIISAIFFIFLLTWQSGLSAWESIRIKQSSFGGLISFPYWPSKIAVPIGCLLMGFQLLVDLIEVFSGRVASRQQGLF